MTNRIDVRLAAAKASGVMALAPFVTVGYPDLETSVEIAAAILDAGADLLELGVPFSDPLAEGPTIQKTSLRALEQGVNVATCLDVVTRLRGRGVEAPLLLMGYYNPFLRYGLRDFVGDAADAAVDGLIVPDLPIEEAGPLNELCKGRNLHLIPLLAPTSTDERISQACKEARGFIYCVQFAGVTGARDNIRAGVAGLVGRIRRHTALPVLVGFGVSRREHLTEISRFADGAAFGSALLDAIDKAPKARAVETARTFLESLRVADSP
jgi:tryptophan synthase alpha chain